MVDSFVAINIYKDKDNKKELFGNGVPLLFYCNDMEHFKDDLLSDEKFRKLIENNCLNINSYTSSWIGYFHFNTENEYEDTIIPIQELFSINKLSEVERYFIKDYLSKIFTDLYKISIKKNYDNNLIFDIDSIIVDIYKKLQEKFKEKIIKSTVINYVRSELNKENLTQENINLIIEQLEKILEYEV